MNREQAKNKAKQLALDNPGKKVVVYCTKLNGNVNYHVSINNGFITDSYIVESTGLYHEIQSNPHRVLEEYKKE